ncbi:MAG TPA: hypothetical protein VNA25_23055, partial [Phycisphaerae bacterium]|nr:hypothetical protein [Phycisphaerae bacterium]
ADLIGNLQYKGSREAARNNWTQTSARAKFGYAAEGLKREAVAYDTALLLQIEQAPNLVKDKVSAKAAIDSVNNANDTGVKKDSHAFEIEAVNQQRADLAVKQIAANFLMAEVATRPEVLDEANEVLEDLYGEEVPEGAKFTPAEIAEMRDGYKRSVKTAEAEAKRERDAVADAYDADVTVMTLSGQFTRKDKNGNKIDTRQEIINHPYLTPARKTTLTNQWDAAVAAYAKGEKYSEQQKLDAYIQIRTEADPTKKLELMTEHSAGLGFTEMKSIYEKMNKTTGDDSILASSLNTAISAVRSFRTSIVKDADEYEGSEDDRAAAISKLNINLLRTQNNILREWDAHPEWTDDQRITAMEATLIPVKAEAGKEIVDSWWKRMWKGYSAPRGPMTYGRWAPMQTPSSKKEKPTEEELRRLNTPEAYQKGVELGYWK